MAIIQKDLYFEWLLDKIDGEEYYSILRRLYNAEFYWMPNVGLDENRALDGLRLREDYIRETDNEPYYCPEKCSVLELLIAMSIKCEEDVMKVNGAGDRTIEWFWIMMDNLGLYNDELENDLKDEVYQKSAEDQIDYILEKWMSRSYDRDGSNGGLFTVSNPRQDMRNVDLWMQLNWWLVEKYGYESEL